MSKYKYVLNWGLAFDEEKQMKKFSELAKQGWILEKMSVFYYRLVKGQPMDITYSLDYKKLAKGDEVEYFCMFESGGWNHVCSYDQFHIFYAPPHTVPIYTEREQEIGKFQSVKKGYVKALNMSLLLLLLTVVVNYIGVENEFINGISNVVAILAAMVFLPSLMVSVAYWYRERL